MSTLAGISKAEKRSGINFLCARASSDKQGSEEVPFAGVGKEWSGTERPDRSQARSRLRAPPLFSPTSHRIIQPLLPPRINNLWRILFLSAICATIHVLQLLGLQPSGSGKSDAPAAPLPRAIHHQTHQHRTERLRVGERAGRAECEEKVEGRKERKELDGKMQNERKTVFLGINQFNYFFQC